MIQKQYCSLSDASSAGQDKPLVVTITGNGELITALKIHGGRHGLRGLKFPSSLLQTENLPTLKKSKMNYFEIILEDKEHISLIKEHCYSKNSFTQITISYDLFSTNHLKELQLGCNRLIIDLNGTQELSKEQLNSLFAELITHKFYPFFQNANHNQIEAQFRVEYYENSQNSRIVENQSFISDRDEFTSQRQEGDLL